MLLDLHENMLEWERQRSTQLTEMYVRQKMNIAINILNELLRAKKQTVNFEKTEKLYVNGEIWLQS